MIWCRERICGCAALLFPCKHSRMLAIATRSAAAAAAAVAAVPPRGCVSGHRCAFKIHDALFLPSGEFALFVTTIFSIGCLGWDDDEGCSKM